jgi:hypothetical protein
MDEYSRLRPDTEFRNAAGAQSSHDPAFDPFMVKGNASYSGKGSVPLERRGPKARFVELTSIVLLPWLMFTLVEFLFGYAYQDVPAIVWLLVAGCLTLALIFIALGRLNQQPAIFALGFLCLASVGVAAMVGQSTYGWYMEDFFRLDGGSVYKNVNPADPSSNHADASVITFVDGSFVDTKKSVGYMKEGTVYCVAPVVTRSLTDAPQYWATGVDCCAARGEFECGDAKEVKAQGGVVRPKGDAEAVHYSTAIRMNREVFQQPVSKDGEVVLVWSADALSYADDLRGSAVTLTVVSSILYLATSLLAAQFLLGAIYQNQ